MALDGLDMTVGEGGVHGFLGPNGSGKTTTIRILLGLVRADAGRVHLLGAPVPGRLAAVIGRVGAVVESPQFFPAFSGRRNLRLLAGVSGTDDARVEQVLDVVGMRDRAGDRYKDYSLGMKQRLAIAATMLKEPRLLILDEPTNGLDPAGIRDVRDTMRRLAENGTTVLLSSHLLAEVQQVCDSVTILAGGRQVRSGSVREVLATATGAELRLRVSPADAAYAVLAAAGYAVHREDEHLVVSAVAEPADITRELAAAGLYLSELTPVGPDLESVFLELTGTGEPGVPVAAGSGEVTR